MQSFAWLAFPRAFLVQGQSKPEGWVLEPAMTASKLSKAWKSLQLSQKRHDLGASWLNWGTDEADQQGEASTSALELNCPMVRVLFDELRTLESPNIHVIQSGASCFNFCPEECENSRLHALLKVKSFYQKMEWTVTGSQIYNDAWGLRKLYSYALRREKDCRKRDQTPNEFWLWHSMGIS